MNRKLKLAAAALLGFSAACSSVKNTPSQSAGESPAPADTTRVEHPRVRVMYGVRVPGIWPAPLRDSVKIADEKPDPVAERPEDE